MSLSDAIAEAQTCIKSPPPNESCTCDWVLYPLLLACGYARREIVSRVADNNGQFPDYTVLPDSPHTWYLEAKDWNKRLEDSHAQQSLNYANHNGKRFVVLTNGQIWRLYDNAIQGLVRDKMILEARLIETSEMLSFLGLLEKNTVTSGELERRAAKARLRSLLSRQLFDPASDTISAIRNVLRRDAMLRRIKNEEIISCLREILDSTLELVPTQSATLSSQAYPLPVTTPASAQPDTRASVTVTTWMTNLQELADRIRNEGYQVVAGTKPCLAFFPDGARWDGGDWTDYAAFTVQWLGDHATLSVPFAGRDRGKSYFLNSTPYHSNDQRMLRYREIATDKTTICMFTNMSADDFVIRLGTLCHNTGFAPSDFQVELRR